MNRIVEEGIFFQLIRGAEIPFSSHPFHHSLPDEIPFEFRTPLPFQEYEISPTNEIEQLISSLFFSTLPDCGVLFLQK